MKENLTIEKPFDNYVEVHANKLQFGTAALSLLGAKPGDRLAVNYWTINNEETFPVIGKAEIFTDSNGGNILSKSKTMSFRGNQNVVLSEYGKFFTLETFKTGILKMVPTTKEEESFLSELEDLESINKQEDIEEF